VFGLRVRVGARSGFATTNQPAELRALAAEAVALARQSPPEEGLRLAHLRRRAD
jgi:predicted Zn-dependent protease